MGQNLKVELNGSGIRSMLRSQEVMEACSKEAEKIRKRAGEGYEISEFTGTNRVNVSVYADSDQSISKNRGDKNELLKAVKG